MSRRKTPEERLAEKQAALEKAQEEVRALKREVAQKARKERTRRLIASAAKIEADAGIEIDAEWAAAIAAAIRDGRVARPGAAGVEGGDGR